MYNKIGKVARKFTLYTMFLIIGQVVLISLSDFLFYRKEFIEIINTSLVNVYKNYNGDGLIFIRMIGAVLYTIYEYEKLFIHSSTLVWLVIISILCILALKNQIIKLLTRQKSDS